MGVGVGEGGGGRGRGEGVVRGIVHHRDEGRVGSLGVTSVLAFTMGLLISSLVLAVTSLSWVMLADVTSTCRIHETQHSTNLEVGRWCCATVDPTLPLLWTEMKECPSSIRR